MNITLVNARMGRGHVSSLRVMGSTIVSVGSTAERGDAILDLGGDRLLPGLINAHDHLQLNTLPPLDGAARYGHAREWIRAVDGRRRSDPRFEAHVAVAREARLWIGGMKNLLSGVTTVAHHDPYYASLSDARFPVDVVANYGWSHSLYLDGERRVQDAHRATPASWPWVIHAAEGITGEAAAEFDRLDALGCVGDNTLLVHGIALDGARRARLRSAAAGLVWCPSSNLRLFGRTADVSDLLAAGRVALGTDSRLSGAGDLLEELRIAAEAGGMDESALEPLVTHAAAGLLRLHDRGRLRAGMRADLLVIPGDACLADLPRARVRLVMKAGHPCYGDPDCLEPFSTMAHGRPVRVDGSPKFLCERIAARMDAMPIGEAGLE